jgi:hypothetical protein
MGIKYAKSLLATIVVVLVASACSGADDTADPPVLTTVTVAPSDAGGAGGDDPTSEPGGSGSDEPSSGDEAPPADAGGSSSGGDGVILADVCSEGQPVNGGVSLDDLVTFGLFTSNEATVEGTGAYDAATYGLFGFLCNITEVGGEENSITIGVSDGSGVWDVAVGSGPIEQIGDWEVIVGSNWLSPLTMRTTDSAGNQDSLFVTWVPGDGSIPDAATLERVMRPLAEAMATRTTVDIPRG